MARALDGASGPGRSGGAVAADILARYARTRKASAAVEAIDAGYPGGLDTLEKDWRAWLKRGAGAVQLPIATAPAAPEAGWVTCPDGRRIRQGGGERCQTWVQGADGTFRLQ